MGHFNRVVEMWSILRLTDLAVLTGPARGAVTHEAVDLILTVTVDARV